MSFEIFVIAVLLIFNALFALSEFAIVSANKHILRQWMRDGEKRAKVALRLAEDSGKFLSTIQIGITLIGTLAGAYGGATIAEKLEPYFNSISFIYPHGGIFSVVLVVIIITYCSVVVGELLPKQIALSNPEKVAIRVAPIMNVFSKIFSPIVTLLEFSSYILLKIFGIKNLDKKITEEEVKAIIQEGVESGVIEREEQEMIQRITRLGDRAIKSIMSHRTEVIFLDYNDDLESVKEKMRLHRHARYPVMNYKNGKIEGVIQAKDILNATLSGEVFDIKNFLKSPTILPENTNCLQLLKIFRTSATHLVVIIDEYGDVQGIVTLADILEAIVGTISSNYSPEKQPHIIKLKGDNSWLVDGITSIEEVNLAIGTKLDYSYDTIAGFLMHLFVETPKETDYVEYSGYNFEIIDMDNYRIDKIIIKKLMD